ncbi:ABC transporter permease [Microlunatus speluncae]|uniref:ABC transporter permease n=1 Tax=Microlunatus speluncae TaxID=2594267 RepID=UPI0012666C55|nr:ABC transporter permease [Microlunatus speluncae]
MSTLRYAAADTLSLARRKLLHILRYPGMTLILVGMPIIFMLLFVYVFGGTLGAGIGGSRADYINYVVPGILVMGVAASANGVAVSAAMDMTEGIIARFRTMAIFRPSVLASHVIGGVVQTLLITAVVIGVALLIGFRSSAGPLQWLGVVGVIVMIGFALTWLCVALGLVAKTVESASNLPMPLTLLPFLGSGFVPTDSMPFALKVFADYQPFTPIMETLRGLLFGTPIGLNGMLAVAWCLLISIVGFVWSRHLYRRDPTR